MSHLDLLLLAALMGAGAAARREALAQPPAELLENLDLLNDMPFIEEGEDEE
jgi:hypothetical protein